MARGKNAIGLDIGSHSIKLTCLKEAKGGYSLLNFGMVQLPPEAIVDGAVMNSSAVVDALKDLVASQKTRTKEAAIGVSGHSVIIKKINLPTMTEEELEESIQWEAEQYIPFDINDVNIDVQILTLHAKEQGQMEVLLVAAKKDIINDYTGVVIEAGLQPVVIDVDAFALQNMFEINYPVSPNETVALVNIGAAVVNINIISGGVSAFTRDISMGGDLFTEEIQKQLNVSYEEAEALKVGGESAADKDSVVPQDVERILRSVSETMTSEIQRSLDFFSATTVESQISKIYLSGGTSKIPALAKVIEHRSGTPVEVVNPFKNVQIDERKFDVAYLKSVGPIAAITMGLALRKAGDK